MEERGETWAYAAISLNKDTVEGSTVWNNLQNKNISERVRAMGRDETRTSTAREGVREGSWRRMGAKASADMIFWRAVNECEW